MQCPVDGETLVIAERSGVEIDYCPKCRGVWLDRGELDKIVERSSQQAAPAPGAPQPQTQQPYHHGDKRMHDSDYGKQRPRKRSSWLSELFD